MPTTGLSEQDVFLCWHGLASLAGREEALSAVVFLLRLHLHSCLYQFLSLMRFPSSNFIHLTLPCHERVPSSRAQQHEASSAAPSSPPPPPHFSAMHASRSSRDPPLPNTSRPFLPSASPPMVPLMSALQPKPANQEQLPEPEMPLSFPPQPSSSPP